MSVADELKAFVADHRAHGPIEAGANEPDAHGYRAWAVCACGALWQRWVTDADATWEMVTSDLLAGSN
jgi:hypothetical protein